MNRASKLNKRLDAILYGKEALRLPRDGSLVLEAICAQPDPASCIKRLIGSKVGLESVQACMRFDLSTSFLNGHATNLLIYLQSPMLKTINGGSFLSQLLLKIVDPPYFWEAFTRAFQDGLLQDKGRLSFAWLLLQLISLPKDIAPCYQLAQDPVLLAQDPVLQDSFISSSQEEIKAIGYQIKHIIASSIAGIPVDTDNGPGGRHDNDFLDFRDIAILPTSDEITSAIPSFLRPRAALTEPETEKNRLAIYLDNQFRLLREDMLYEMREELQIARGVKKGIHRGIVIDGLRLLYLHTEKDGRRCKWGITLQCEHDMWQFKKVASKDRKAHLADNRKFLMHQSMTCLIVDDEIVAFPAINRDEDLLAKKPPIIVLQLEGEAATVKALIKLKTAKRIKLIQIDTAVFSFEPVLKALQKTKVIPLSPELLFWKEGIPMEYPPFPATNIIQAIGTNPSQDLRKLLKTPKSIVLDKSQAASLLSGLTQRVSLIQGSPGTGKSFIGALLAKVLHDSTKQTVLVVCFTNHALDQFLEELLDIGIPGRSMVRLGGKSTPRTEMLALQTQKTGSQPGKADWSVIDKYKFQSGALGQDLQAAFGRYKSGVSNEDLLGFLELEDPAYYEAFSVPQSSDGMTRVGKKGRAINRHYLVEQWAQGQDAGVLKCSPHILKSSEIWGMAPRLRQAKLTKWRQEITTEKAENIYAIAKEYNNCQSQLDQMFSGTSILKSKRIIGCTTTAAAKYSEGIQAASPGVLLVEEAGEILESHVLTALGCETKHLILIGDHKQLRPKVNHYSLTVEKGDGYDLNMSMFERLVLQGYPHQTLTQQHRMRPEISALIRQLTYPDLLDAAGTKNRPNLRGVRDNIVFVNHDHPEDDAPQLSDQRDANSTTSKQNTHEVGMILKIVRYLAQQGYGTDKIVILTPYLGQLLKLQAALKKDNDPILNDLDSYDLVRAGLMPAATAKVSKKSIRLATIDNYQGEESDIVLVTLTRSNPAHEIGFMFSPERLNVLLSRARDALIMVGNAETFMKSRKGKELWTRFFDLLKHGSHIYDGLPVKCERHQDRTALLSREEDFDEECPDGGCKEPCGVILNCGLHICPSKCHQLYDHSKMACEHLLYSKCPKGHNQSWMCHKILPTQCMKCEREAKLAEKRQKEAFALQQKRDADQLADNRRLAELEEKIALERQTMQDAQLAKERKNVIRQKEKDLEMAVSAAREAFSCASTDEKEPALKPSSQTAKSGPTTTPDSTLEPSIQTPQPKPKSSSEEDWQRQKDVEGASNDAIDAIMGMTGLEEVKAQILRIKSKIDLTKRQNTSLKDERFNLTLLGNPGTGKTTVARLYAQFLASVQVLPGNEFIETTGSRLANDGVAGIKKHIEQVINGGGGTIFVDEAYQLTSQHNLQGRQVLDFLLAEMENNVGTIVFILAGYSQQMEKFFEHNPGLPSRVPYILKFADYTDTELLKMLGDLVEKKNKIKVEGGVDGLYSRIAVRRLGQTRGQEGFGNARALHNMFARVRERQAERIAKQRKAGLIPDDFLLVKEDLIGPDPSQAILENVAWEKLQSLIGLTTVKDSVRNLIDNIGVNYQRELQELQPIQMSLNRVFLGAPGTGKTTVAQLYGKILADLGLLSNGEVVLKNPADFIGSALGQSESNTKAILSSTVGKVLIIDEAYMLYGGTGGSGDQNDQYKTAVIDTIVAEVQSVPGEDRCVLLLGYEKQIVEMFQKVNPGLSRRFAIEDAFHFNNFSDSELLEILNLKLKNQDLGATVPAKTVAIEVLSRARNRPNFGNAGEVENLLRHAKNRFTARRATLPVRDRSSVMFLPEDFDPDFNRNAHASANLKKLFEDVVGCDDTIMKLEEYQHIASVMKARGIDARNEIPTNFVFKGPPGTGKTTTARKMGKVYYDMGFLSSTDVIECSVSDLVGQYVGHTGPKITRVLEKALGKVLFIDEAYRLSEGHFAKEAIDELVTLLTQDTFKSKLIVILAGYDQEMNSLMAVNTGLSSRFPDEVVFHNMQPSHCLEVLSRELRKKDIHLDELADPSSMVYMDMAGLIDELSSLPSWGNARDIVTLSKQMIHLVLKSLPAETSTAELTLSGKDAISCMKSMLTDRRERCANVPARTDLRTMGLIPPPLHPPPPSIRMTQAIKTSAKKETALEEDDGRDAGVTDEIWRQLQQDKQAEETASQDAKEALRVLEQNLREAKEREDARLLAHQKLANARAKDLAEQNELKRMQEEARLQRLAAMAEREAQAAALEARRKEEERKRQQEAKAQAALRRMGVCCAGYQWIKQQSGYRCAGGSHFVGNDALKISD